LLKNEEQTCGTPQGGGRRQKLLFPCGQNLRGITLRS